MPRRRNRWPAPAETVEAVGLSVAMTAERWPAHPDADHVDDGLRHEGDGGAGEMGPPGNLVQQDGTRVVGVGLCAHCESMSGLKGHAVTPGIEFRKRKRKEAGRSVAGGVDEQAETEAHGTRDQQGGEGVFAT